MLILIKGAENMDLETREELDLDKVEVLTKFRWKITSKHDESYNTQSNLYGTKTVYTLTRSKSIVNYSKISELENEYFRLEYSMKKPVKLFKPTAIFLTILGILPGVIYIINHKVKNRRILKNNEKARVRMGKIIEEVYLL